MIAAASLLLSLAARPQEPDGTGWKLARLDLVVHVLPAEQRLVVEGHARLVLGIESSPGPTLAINSRAALMTFEEVRSPGLEVDLEARHPAHPNARLARLRRAQPFVAGDEVQVDLLYASAGGDAQFAVQEQVAFASWTQGWTPAALPEPGVRLATASRAAGTTTFHLPAGWRSVSNGRMVEHTEGESGCVEVWELERPVARSFAAGPYTVTTHQVGGREIGIYRLGQGSGEVQAETLAAALAAQEARFGPYPYASYRVAEIPPVAGAFMASSEQGLILAKSVCFEPEDGNIALFGHEMAHGWWGNLVGGDGPGSILLDESLAQYSAAIAIEGVYGRDAMTEFLRFSRPGYIPGQCARGYFELWRRGADKPLMELQSGGTDHQLSDAKGHWVYHMLRRKVGDEVFFATLRGVIADFTERELTWAELRARFGAAAPDAGLEEFFEQWLERAGAPILDSRWTPTAGGVALTVTQVGPGAPYRLDLDVALDGSEGTVLRRVDLRAREQTFELAVAGEVRDVRLDPEHALLIWHPDYGERPR